MLGVEQIGLVDQELVRSEVPTIVERQRFSNSLMPRRVAAEHRLLGVGLTMSGAAVSRPRDVLGVGHEVSALAWVGDGAASTRFV